MKTIIAGSRDADVNIYGLDQLIRTHKIRITEVVCGGAPGVDTCGKLWAEWSGIPVKMFRADWSLGKKAGPIRNQQMADYAQAAIVIHHGTSGSLDMLRRARAKGLRVVEVVLPPDSTPRRSY